MIGLKTSLAKPVYFLISIINGLLQSWSDPVETETLKACLNDWAENFIGFVD